MTVAESQGSVNAPLGFICLYITVHRDQKKKKVFQLSTNVLQDHRSDLYITERRSGGSCCG
jgi:hypothetical protein